LIELLVIVAILGAVVGILVPTLSSVRKEERHLRCLANLRSANAAWRMYGAEHNDRTPALGVPWGDAPNWSIVVSRYANQSVRTAADLPSGESAVLVCPSTQRRYPDVAMTRTYAANVTGFAGAKGDGGDFDEEPTSVRFSQVRFPGRTPMLLDSAPAQPGPGMPPPTRTASVIDFRDDAHVAERIGRVHGMGVAAERFQAVFYDGSAGRREVVDADWRRPIAE